MLRTIAICERKWIVIIPLTLISLGQWALFYHSMVTLDSQWQPCREFLHITGTSSINVVYLYSEFRRVAPHPCHTHSHIPSAVSFNVLILALTTTGLLLAPARSNLWHLLFADGIIYFIATLSVNILAAVSF